MPEGPQHSTSRPIDLLVHFLRLPCRPTHPVSPIINHQLRIDNYRFQESRKEIPGSIAFPTEGNRSIVPPSTLPRYIRFRNPRHRLDTLPRRRQRRIKHLDANLHPLDFLNLLPSFSRVLSHDHQLISIRRRIISRCTKPQPPLPLHREYLPLGFLSLSQSSSQLLSRVQSFHSTTRRCIRQLLHPFRFVNRSLLPNDNFPSLLSVRLPHHRRPLIKRSQIPVCQELSHRPRHNNFPLLVRS